jgi:hypothetical protein
MFPLGSFSNSKEIGKTVHNLTLVRFARNSKSSAVQTTVEGLSQCKDLSKITLPGICAAWPSLLWDRNYAILRHLMHVIFQEVAFNASYGLHGQAPPPYIPSNASNTVQKHLRIVIDQSAK